MFHGRYSPAFASPDPLSSPVSSTRFRFRPGYSPRSRRNSTAVETLRPTLPPCTCYACDGTEPPRLIWLNWKIKRLFRGNKLSRPSISSALLVYTRAVYVSLFPNLIRNFFLLFFTIKYVRGKLISMHEIASYLADQNNFRITN